MWCEDIGRAAVESVGCPHGAARSGFGESVLQVLHIAADAAMKRKRVLLLKADCSVANDNDDSDEYGGNNNSNKNDTLNEDGEGTAIDPKEEEDLIGDDDNEHGSGFHSNSGAGGHHQSDVTNEDDEAYVEGIVEVDHGAVSRTEEEEEAKAMVESNVDEHLWRMEVDRVVPKLRLTIAAASTDWRAHVDHLSSLKTKLVNLYQHDDNQIRQNVSRMSEDIGNSINELKAREEALNRNLETTLTEYKQQREKINTNQEQYKSVTDNVAELSNELATVSAKLNEIKTIVDERGSNLSDSSPLVKIKNAIAKLKDELHSMDVRIGVAEHSLLSTQRRNSSILMNNENDENFNGENSNTNNKRAMSTWRKG